MNFSDINEMLIVYPDEPIEDVTKRYSDALDSAIEIVREHMDPSVDTLISYDESDVSPLTFVDDDPASDNRFEIGCLQIQIENMINKKAVLKKLKNLAIPPSEIVIYPSDVSVYWYFEIPLIVHSDREHDLVNDTFATIMFDLGIDQLADFFILFYPPLSSEL